MDSANWAQLFCTASLNPTVDCGPQMPPAPKKASPKQQGKCLVANSTSFPCPGGWKDSCPVSLGSCSDITADWVWRSMDGGEATLSNDSPAYVGSVLNIDCNACTSGTLVKVSNNEGYASGIVYSQGQLQSSHCPGMCLSGVSLAQRNTPCKAGEFFENSQVILVPCTSPDANGWTV